MVAKPDFSRLVMLDLTPTEAATLAVWLDSKLFGRINLQLDQLHWSRERCQAPYPI